MLNWEIARLRVRELTRIDPKTQAIYNALAAQRHIGKRRLGSSIVLAVKDFILHYAEKLYCRTLSLMYSKSC